MLFSSEQCLIDSLELIFSFIIICNVGDFQMQELNSSISSAKANVSPVIFLSCSSMTSLKGNVSFVTSLHMYLL